MFANIAETTIPIQTSVNVHEATDLEIETNKKMETKKCLKKTVSFEDENPKFRKEKTPSEANPRMAEHFGATSFISVLKQFGRHNGKEENRKVSDINQEENKTNEIEDNSTKVIQPSTIPKEGIASNSPEIENKEYRKEDNIEEFSSFYHSNVQRIDDKCNMLKNMLEEFLTDIQEDDKASATDFIPYKTAFSANEASIMPKVDNKQKTANIKMSVSYDDKEKETTEFSEQKENVIKSLVDESHQVIQMEDFYESLLCKNVQSDSPGGLESQSRYSECDKEVKENELSQIENRVLEGIIEESSEVIQREDFYATLICEAARSDSPDDLEYQPNYWEDDKEEEEKKSLQSEKHVKEGLIDESCEVIQMEDFYATLLCQDIHSDSPDDLEYQVNYWDTAFLFDYDDNETKICGDLYDQKLEIMDLDFHAESHAALQAEKMHEMLTLKETTSEVSKDVIDEIIDLSKEAFEATKINSYIDDIYNDIKSKREDAHAKSKLMTYIDDVYSEMKSSKNPEQLKNNTELHQKVKNNFETYVNDVYQELRTKEEPTITVHSKLMSYVDDAYYQIKTQKVYEAPKDDSTKVKDKLFDYIDDIYMQIKANKDPQVCNAELKKDSFGKEETISSSVQESPHQAKEIIPSESLISMVAHCPWISEDTKTSLLLHHTNNSYTDHLISSVSHKPVTEVFSNGSSILSHVVNNLESQENSWEDILSSSMVVHFIQNPSKGSNISQISHQYCQPVLGDEYSSVSHQAGTKEDQKDIDIQTKLASLAKDKDTSLDTIHQKSGVQFDLELVASSIEDNSTPNFLISANKEDSVIDDEYIACDSGYNSLKRSKTYPTDIYQTGSKQKGDFFSINKDIENRWVLIEDLDSKYENEMGIDQENFYDDAVIDDCCNLKTDDPPKGTKIGEDASKEALKLRCIQLLMDKKVNKSCVDAKIHENSEKQINEVKCIDSFMTAKHTTYSDSEKVSRSDSINLPDLETVMKGNILLLEMVEPVYCKNRSHRHFDSKGHVKSSPSSPYNSLKKSKKEKENSNLQMESGCNTQNIFLGNISSYEKAFSEIPLTTFTQETIQEHMKVVNSMVCVHKMLDNKHEMNSILFKKAKQSDITAQEFFQDSLEVVNSMTCVHTFLNKKFATNLNTSTMVAHEVKETLYKPDHDNVTHATANIYNEDNFTMVAHEVKQEIEKPPPLGVASNSLDRGDTTMLAHKVNQRTGGAHNHNNDSNLTMAAHAVRGTNKESSLTMLAHKLCFPNQMDRCPITMNPNEVKDSLKTSSTTMLAHTFVTTEKELPNISTVAHAVSGQKDRSQSVESDTVVADIETDEEDLFEEEEDDIYSSDDEWEYERKDKSDHNRNMKPFEKNNKSSNTEALNKEIEIMKEIIQNDIGNRNELDSELCALLSSQVYGDTIERTKEDLPVLTGMKKIEEHLVKSIEVIDIAQEVTGEFIKSSITLKCTNTEKSIPALFEAGSVISKEDDNKLEVKYGEQQIVFPWDIKVRSNWDNSCKEDEIKVK